SSSSNVTLMPYWVIAVLPVCPLGRAFGMPLQEPCALYERQVGEVMADAPRSVCTRPLVVHIFLKPKRSESSLCSYLNPIRDAQNIQSSLRKRASIPDQAFRKFAWLLPDRQ